MNAGCYKNLNYLSSLILFGAQRGLFERLKVPRSSFFPASLGSQAKCQRNRTFDYSALMGMGLHSQRAANYARPMLHDAQAHSRLFHVTWLEAFPVVADSEQQPLGTAAQFNLDLPRNTVPHGIVDGFLGDPVKRQTGLIIY